MRRAASLAAVLVALSLASLAQADETPIPPSPRRFVTDAAGRLSGPQRDALDQRLEGYARSTGHQVLVWIGTTLGDASIEDWSARAFAAWRVGRRGMDDGLVLFVFASDRKVRIEVGYGLEGVVTDAQASRTIREVIVPRLRAGDFDGAVGGAVDRLLALVGGESGATARPAPAARGERGGGLGQKIAGGVVALLFLILFITNPRLAMLLLFSIASGRRGGGFGGGGGGGFSGGGGSSGGGGASGSW